VSAPDDRDEGFLQRWSRRKRQLAEEEAAAEAVPASPEESLVDAATGEAEPAGAVEDPELVAHREAAEAVDIDSLTYESDFTVFMKRGVPEALKNAALRKLWRSNPVLAAVDGLNDYDLDYRTVDTILTNFQSAWKVGKGYSDKAEEIREEMEAKSAALAAEREAEALKAEAEEGEAEASDEDGADNEQATASNEPLQEGSDEHQPKPANRQNVSEDAQTQDEVAPVRKVPIRRRMAFDFDD
jgi:hypothetical protein